MEIYSEEQLKRILKSSKKNVVVEIMDMNDQFQFNLHKEINDLVLNEFNEKITLLKINRNFFTQLFDNNYKDLTFLVYKNNQQINQNNGIKNISDFKAFINSLF